MPNLKVCKNCHQTIVSTARTCPYCGAKQNQMPIWAIVVGVLLLVCVIANVLNRPTQPEVRTSAEVSDTSSASSQTSSQESSPAKQESENGLVSENAPVEEELYKITYQRHEEYVDILGDLSCDTIIEIENTSVFNLFLKDCNVSFESPNGDLLATCDALVSDDPNVIAPGEKGYFYFKNGTINGDLDINEDYVFVPKLKVEKSRNPIVRYDISDVTLSETSDGYINIIGKITNSDTKKARLAWVAIILYDAEDIPIAIVGTTLKSIEPGETTTFSRDVRNFFNKDISISDVASYTVLSCKTQIQ